MMRMSLVALATCLAMGVFPARADIACDMNLGKLGARFELTLTLPDDEAETGRRQLTIWRQGERLVHELSEPAITQVWARVAPDKYQLTRYFDAHQRGIEYQPGEPGTDAASVAWQERRELVPAERRLAMRLTSSSGEGCEQVETYVLDEDGISAQLEWLPAVQLPRSYTLAGPGGTTRWRLLELVSDPESVVAAFNARSNWPSMDFADIGDNEADPFIDAMTRQGYIEHAHNSGSEHAH